jgi:hypothetical protein
MSSRKSLICGLLLSSSLILAASARASSIGPTGDGVFALAGDQNQFVLFYGECGGGPLGLSSSSCSTGTFEGFASDGTPFSDSASASSALAAGALSVKGTTVGSDEGVAQNSAYMGDTLYFSGGTPYEVGSITVTATGTHSGDGSVSIGLGEQFESGSPGVGVVALGCVASTSSSPGTGCSSVSAYTAGIALPVVGVASSDGTNLSFTLDFPLFSSGVYFRFSLSGESAGDGSYSYEDPITLTLPAGVTYTSDSGEFLTGTGSAVPEPASIMLLGTGLVAALSRFRRRRSRSAS